VSDSRSVIVDYALYTNGRRQPGEMDLHEAFEAARTTADSFVWIGLHDPTDDEFAEVADEVVLHPLAVEDAVHAHQRPKLETYDGMLFVVTRTAHYDDLAETVDFAEVEILAGEGYVVTVRHGPASPLSGVRQALEQDPGRLALGPMAVVHGVLDRVVDDYFPVLEGLDNDIDESESQVFAPERTNPAPRMYRLKRQVLHLYRSTEALVEPLVALRHGRHPFAGHELDPYFRDVEDHVRKAVSWADGQLQVLSDALNVNLAQISVQQNEDMRKISGWAAIAAAPTMLAGIWGMNFDDMPELDEPWGYPLALGVMLGVAFAIYRLLRRRGWI
jgi:magnesium transporter